MAARVRLREIAEARGWNMSMLARESKQNLNLIRRYWYNTSNGLKHGPPLLEVSLPALAAIAAALGVEPGELIGSETEDE